MLSPVLEDRKKKADFPEAFPTFASIRRSCGARPVENAFDPLLDSAAIMLQLNEK
jgi:hypothetical protein